ncbi:hypothetical protein RP20_CCG010077 [Aedes albopictus]|nr:hypothetical protein RP20_CCG010077 [Aedes albopictus]
MNSNTLLSVLVHVAFYASGLAQDVPESICSGISFGILPHPTNCQKYIACVLSTASVNECGFNFVFHPLVSFCVPRSVYQWPNEAQPTPSPSTEAPPSTTNVPEVSSTPSSCQESSWEPIFCRGHVSDLIRNPFNCTQYIDCKLATPTNRECPPGKVFSLPYQDCFPGDSGRCLLKPIDPSFCETRPDGNYPHPYRCNRFVTCFRNSARVESCLPYHVLNPATMQCVKGDVLGCSSLLSQA